MTPSSGLERLEQRLREDWERLGLPAADWLGRTDDDPYDVVLVGGGMAGLAAAAALRFLGVYRVKNVDAAPRGRVGPWVTHARMETLRSPKDLVGPAWGQPSLTFRAWYEARFSRTAWDELGRIPRVLWQDYLDWYQRVQNLEVAYETRIVGLEPDPSDKALVAVTAEAHGARTSWRARHVVLATGMDALGRPSVPGVVAALPRGLWNHNTEAIDFGALRGRRVGVVGGGDSALDAAATALESGAAEVLVFVRSPDFSTVNHWKAFVHPGHLHGFPTLGPDDQARLLGYLKSQKTPPAQGTIARLSRFSNLRIHFTSPVEGLEAAGNGAVVTTPHGRYPVDHLIVATGYEVDLESRPELRSLAPHVRFWDDQRSPVLGSDFSFQEKEPGAWPTANRIHLFTGASLRSLGKVGGDIPGIGLGAERLARGIAARLYADDVDAQLRRLQDYREPEVRGDEWSSVRVDHP
jgi:cation diffusion facilitator CzcD-associated flavoprotein CzcO